MDTQKKEVESKKEIKVSILERYSKLSKEEKVNFKKTASPEELKQLIKEQASAKIAEGNRKLQALKAKDRKEDTRKLILLGAYFKNTLLNSSIEFIEQFIDNITKEINDYKDVISGIEKQALEIQEKIKNIDKYKTTSEETEILSKYRKTKKILKDSEIIALTFNTLRKQVDDQTVEDSDQSDQQDTDELIQDSDQQS